MADLLVRGVDEAIVRALNQRAGAHGRSLAELLAAMPDVGEDEDFARQPGCACPIRSSRALRSERMRSARPGPKQPLRLPSG